MNTLTYADRDLLIRVLADPKHEYHHRDSDLLVGATSWAKRLVPVFGFEHSLIRDVTTLCRYLTQATDDAGVANIARGAIRYMLHTEAEGAIKLGRLGLIGKAFVASYSVYEIRARLGEMATYNPPRLMGAEKEQAENLFLDFIDQPFLTDEELVTQARRIASELGHLAESGFFRRLQKNIDFLICSLTDSSTSAEHRSFARAALSYIVCENDAIDDRAGIIGYLDDNSIAQLAVDFIAPAREPWLEVLDATVGSWPFLNWLNIDDGDGARPISEYMIINSALSCSELRGSDRRATCLITPIPGPTPFLLGFVAALGLVHEAAKKTISEASFTPGQKVRIGKAIAEFIGVTTEYGQTMIALRQDRTHEGCPTPVTTYWPVSELYRLIPEDETRATRGALIQSLGADDTPLPALEYLFHAAAQGRLMNTCARILAVTPVAAASDMAKRMHLCAQQLRDVIPMGHLTMDGTIKRWSTTFGQIEPLLVVTSDLDLACAFAECQPNRTRLVVVDASGRNANKVATLRQLQHSNVPTLIVASDRTADELSIMEDDSVDLWEWDVSDFSELLWPHHNSASGGGTIASYERRLRSLPTSVPRVERINCPVAEEVFEGVRRLSALARQRQEDKLVELDECVDVAFGMMSRLLRSATPLTNEIPSTNEVAQGIERLGTVHRTSIYLSDAERSAVNGAAALLKQFHAELRATNRKAAIVHEAMNAEPNLSVICPDSRILADLLHMYPDRRGRILSDYIHTQSAACRGAVVPGWYGKERMARLLVPPVTQPLILVLYDVEHRWRQMFEVGRHKHRTKRSPSSGRARIFPAITGWNKPRIEFPRPASIEPDADTPGYDAIHEAVRTAHRQRLYRAARSDGEEAEVSARLVLFEAGAHAFVRESYKANVVTHLLDATVEDAEDEGLDVRRKTVRELKAGDALLFHRRSDRDVIRTVADEELASSVRHTASLWRHALIAFSEREGLTARQLWQRLKHGGCPLEYQTIQGWLDDDEMIAPRQYERDVRIVASVTNDRQLNTRLDVVLGAIGEVFGAHQRASSRIARQVLRRAVECLKEEYHDSSLFEIESGILLVRVVEIDDALTEVRASVANRLQESDEWRA